MEISDYDDDFIASLEIFSHLDFSSRNIDPNYHLCVEESINILRSQQQTNSVPNINGNMIMAKDFYSECWDKKGRLRIAIGKRQYETYYKIFPWFAYDLMLRQNKDSFREGVPCDTGPRLTEALNYFRNRSYNDDDLQQLRCYFLAFEQTFGKTIKVVSLILQLYHLCITPSSSGGPIHVTVPSPSLNCAALDGDYYPTSPSINDDTMSPLGSSKKSNSIDLEDIVDRVACLEFKEEIQKSELQGLKERMGRIEEIQNNGHDVNQHAIKRPREGCDRANWVKIRPDDYPTKNEWCLPGRVFGLYGDGIGPLRSKKIGGPIWHDVRVYSAKPDIIEAHKDPGNPDQYAPVVMVGEAPVLLSDKQTQKLKRLNSQCWMYVNQDGEVNVRPIDKERPTGGVIFASTAWNESRVVDGVPMFQDVPGVCAEIAISTNGPPKVSTPVDKFLHKSQREITNLAANFGTIWQTFLPPTSSPK